MRHGRFLYTVAYRLTGNHDDAQDLVPGGAAASAPGAGHLRAGLDGGLVEPDHHERVPRRGPQAQAPALPTSAGRSYPSLSGRRRRSAAEAVLAPHDPSRRTCRRRCGTCSEDYRAAVVLCDVLGYDYERDRRASWTSRSAPCAAASTAAAARCGRSLAGATTAPMPGDSEHPDAGAALRLPRRRPRRGRGRAGPRRTSLDLSLVPGPRSSSCGSCERLVRHLPFVEPPFGFYERTLRLGPAPRAAPRGASGSPSSPASPPWSPW